MTNIKIQSFCWSRWCLPIIPILGSRQEAWKEVQGQLGLEKKFFFSVQKHSRSTNRESRLTPAGTLSLTTFCYGEFRI